MESWTIIPGEMTLPYTYAPLAPFEAVKERRSGVGVRWRACISVLTAVAVVVPVVARKRARRASIMNGAHLQTIPLPLNTELAVVIFSHCICRRKS